MGEPGDVQFLETLEELARDPEATVRETAEKSRRKLAEKAAVMAANTPKEPKPRPNVATDGAGRAEQTGNEKPPNGWLTGRGGSVRIG